MLIRGVDNTKVLSNTFINSFYVSVRAYNSASNTLIKNNVVTIDYDEMNPAIFERSDATDFSQPASDAFGPRCGGIWFAQGSDGPGDSLGDAAIEDNHINYLSYPAGNSLSEKWAAYNINPSSINTGSIVSFSRNTVANPISRGIIVRGIGPGTIAGASVYVSDTKIENAYRHGIEIVSSDDVHIIKNTVTGYDQTQSGLSAYGIYIRGGTATNNCKVLNNYVSQGVISTANIENALIDEGTNTILLGNDLIDVSSFSTATPEIQFIMPSVSTGVWTDIPNINLSKPMSFRINAKVLVSINEGSFAEASFYRTFATSGLVSIGPVEKDTTTGAIDLRVNANIPQIFVTYTSGDAVRNVIVTISLISGL